MQPERESKRLLAKTRSKAKMYEYFVPENEHITIDRPLSDLLDLTIGVLGDLSTADFNTENSGSNKDNALFSAQYFDALIQSQYISTESDYLKLLGACAYYLGDFPGSSYVLTNHISEDVDLKASQLEQAILALLKKTPINLEFIKQPNLYYSDIILLSNALDDHFNNGSQGALLNIVQNIRTKAYRLGSNRELFFSDLICALSRKYLKNSSWNTLPYFSGLAQTYWSGYMRSQNSVKELWPAQLLIGEQGVFKGESAVIQMPTSAGKTKSAELIIRSAIFRNQSRISVIVAPFRALCQEIYDSLNEHFKAERNISLNLVSDVLQTDLVIEETDAFQILILTPEKFDYILRHPPNFVSKIGLVIYDEGHLFDNDKRGAKYELLLTSLKRNISNHTQVVLISAVMPNAEEIGEWLIGNKAQIVKAKNLYPTSRSTAFFSYDAKFGNRLMFVNQNNPDTDEFYVPKVLEIYRFTPKPRQQAGKIYPSLDEPNQIAFALGCRMIKSGAVAIFIGNKRSIPKTLLEGLDAFAKGAAFNKPSAFASQSELEILIRYIQRTLGVESIYAKAAAFGILTHHGSTPHGLRLAVEHAMQKGHAKFILCTSTLAQGVNLPIRYLIITSSRQAGELIKARDFQNLMGRAGRAGFHTEGTVIFADRSVYDNKTSVREKWRWNQATGLIDPDRAEPCQSLMLSLVRNEIDESIKSVVLDDIISYLLNALSDIDNSDVTLEYIRQLVSSTLAYHQANEDEKKDLYELFLSITQSILQAEPDAAKRKIFSRSVLSLEKSIELANAVEIVIGNLNPSFGPLEILDVLWPVLHEFCADLKNKKVQSDQLNAALNLWIAGRPFPEIFDLLQNTDFAKVDSSRRNTPKIDDIVSLCENTFGFNLSLIIGSAIELLELLESSNMIYADGLKELQKMVKHGLPDKLSIRLYEMGFSDRTLALQIKASINSRVNSLNKIEIVRAINENYNELNDVIIEEYPAYFRSRLYEMKISS